MHLVQEIGSYAGFAAVIGLAVLSALYFSQARDVKRLRDWAGRAPERAAEQEARIRATSQPATAQQQQQPAAAQQQTAAQRAAVAGQSRPTAVPAPPPAGTATASPPPSPPAGGAGAPPFRPPAQTSILGGGGVREPERWYRRIEPKYLALIVAGVLVLGGGAAYGVTQLTGKESGGTSPSAAGPATSGTKSKSKARQRPVVNPASVTVAVLNATTVTGAANRIADKLESKGYNRGNVVTASQQGRAESVVEYADGDSAAARAIGRDLGISGIEKVDPQTQSQAGDANVVVILGADKAPAAAG